ncbi:hypothetical protein RvY_03678, partial [Ramazzottius varieornatus]
LVINLNFMTRSSCRQTKNPQPERPKAKIGRRVKLTHYTHNEYGRVRSVNIIKFIELCQIGFDPEGRYYIKIILGSDLLMLALLVGFCKIKTLGTCPCRCRWNFTISTW